MEAQWEARRRQEMQGGARRGQEAPGKAMRRQERPGGARRHQGAATRRQFQVLEIWDSEVGNSSRFWRVGSQMLATVLGFGELGLRSLQQF